jgi:soluble lytic murein transglycosylase-like protein
MDDLKARRTFQQRFLEVSDRSRVRQEVLRSKRRSLDSLRKRYAMMVLGASLAVGGVGIPLKTAQLGGQTSEQSPEKKTTVTRHLTGDLAAAQMIAREVAGGVSAAVGDVSRTVEAPAAQLAAVSEEAKKDYFKKEVPFGGLIYEEAKKNELPPELVAAVVETESRFNPTARSGANAQGLMQLVPRTGKWMGAKNLMNPTENVKAGTKYLAYLTERFDGDQTKILAAYNAGEGNVRRFGGVPPFKETQNYVKKVTIAQKDYEEKVAGKIAETLQNPLDEIAAAR